MKKYMHFSFILVIIFFLYYIGCTVPKGTSTKKKNKSVPTLLRITTSSDGVNRNSRGPQLNADGTKMTFSSDSDFLNDGDVSTDQFEIWLYTF